MFLVKLTNEQGYQNYINFVVRDDARRAGILYQQAVTNFATTHGGVPAAQAFDALKVVASL